MKFLRYLLHGGAIVERSERDRRSPEERRKGFGSVTYSARKYERRVPREKRKDWERISCWSSVPRENDPLGDA